MTAGTYFFPNDYEKAKEKTKQRCLGKKKKSKLPEREKTGKDLRGTAWGEGTHI